VTTGQAGMSGWIKICGMTSAAGVAAAAAAGADAIGFVLAPSVRRVSTRQAAQLARDVRGQLRCVAVMQHPGQAEVDAAVRELEPDLLQTELEDFAALRLPGELGRLPVVREVRAIAGGWPSRLMFEGARSGSGAVADWSGAASIARHTQLVLAGGLHEGNVAEAIHAVRPFGVDASSGLESSPGVKSEAKIRSFVRAARAAFAELGA
jgi:phosphoribosylanthranilate isomerase